MMFPMAFVQLQYFQFGQEIFVFGIICGGTSNAVSGLTQGLMTPPRSSSSIQHNTTQHNTKIISHTYAKWVFVMCVSFHSCLLLTNKDVSYRYTSYEA
mmetsp:Transcript_2289/g.3643  ORF Transcript_2289/g.3643 Transcript_2289/m.3643 type:complete len:98 (+) Transcript_2289:1862-2155(+)